MRGKQHIKRGVEKEEENSGERGIMEKSGRRGRGGAKEEIKGTRREEVRREHVRSKKRREKR